MIETKKKRAVRAAVCVLSALLAVDGARAGAGAGAGAQPEKCVDTVCKVSVGYALPAAGSNDCSVKVPAAVLVPRESTSVEWTLVPPAGGGLPTHRFHPNRIRFDNNDVGDTPAEGHFPCFLIF